MIWSFFSSYKRKLNIKHYNPHIGVIIMRLNGRGIIQGPVADPGFFKGRVGGGVQVRAREGGKRYLNITIKKCKVIPVQWGGEGVGRDGGSLSESF